MAYMGPKDKKVASKLVEPWAMLAEGGVLLQRLSQSLRVGRFPFPRGCELREGAKPFSNLSVSFLEQGHPLCLKMRSFQEGLRFGAAFPVSTQAAFLMIATRQEFLELNKQEVPVS